MHALDMRCAILASQRKLFIASLVWPTDRPTDAATRVKCKGKEGKKGKRIELEEIESAKELESEPAMQRAYLLRPPHRN